MCERKSDRVGPAWELNMRSFTVFIVERHGAVKVASSRLTPVTICGCIRSREPDTTRACEHAHVTLKSGSGAGTGCFCASSWHGATSQ